MRPVTFFVSAMIFSSRSTGTAVFAKCSSHGYGFTSRDTSACSFAKANKRIMISSWKLATRTTMSQPINEISTNLFLPSTNCELASATSGGTQGRQQQQQRRQQQPTHRHNTPHNNNRHTHHQPTNYPPPTHPPPNYHFTTTIDVRPSGNHVRKPLAFLLELVRCDLRLRRLPLVQHSLHISGHSRTHDEHLQAREELAAEPGVSAAAQLLTDTRPIPLPLT